MAEYQTTDEPFDIFREEFVAQCSLLGLTEWDVRVRHHDTEGNLAIVAYDIEAMYADVRLDPTWDIEPTEAELKSTAFHEAHELLLAKLKMMAYQRTASEREINGIVHEVVHKLQHAYYEPLTDSGGDEQEVPTD